MEGRSKVRALFHDGVRRAGSIGAHGDHRSVSEAGAKDLRPERGRHGKIPAPCS